MKTFTIAAALGAALLAPATAFAADSPQERGSGHYEWRDAPQPGPRSTGPTHKRVWVPDHPQMANCDCDMMKMSADDCMKPMQPGSAAPSAG
ncbi:MAG: hypothetical protein B7Z20_00910 [Sphingobium sp. 32-64-5]|jgi:hypothetical protein|nr:MAG: hypothetical protein B7Z20_00910 [Sphingobium sp. 32-64-5]